MTDRLLKVTEAQKIIGVGKSTMYELLTSGRLTAVRFQAGGRLRIRQSDLDAFVAGLTPQPGQPPRNPFGRKSDD